MDVPGRDLPMPYGVGDCPWSNRVVRPCSLPSLLLQLLKRFLLFATVDFAGAPADCTRSGPAC